MENRHPRAARLSSLSRGFRSWWSGHRVTLPERVAALEERARAALSLGEAQRLAMEAEALRVQDGGARRKGIIPLFRN